jgi:hypothetical protein
LTEPVQPDDPLVRLELERMAAQKAKHDERRRDRLHALEQAGLVLGVDEPDVDQRHQALVAGLAAVALDPVRGLQENQHYYVRAVTEWLVDQIGAFIPDAELCPPTLRAGEFSSKLVVDVMDEIRWRRTTRSS